MTKTIPSPAKDFLWLHMRDLPYFRALLRAVESSYYEDFELPVPILDVGCGDGHFASVTFDHPIDVGIDPWRGPIRKAMQYELYDLLIEGDAGQMPFPDNHFSSGLSNSVLEHIPHVEQVLAETGRVLKPGAHFVFCVPNHTFMSKLSIGNFFDRLGLVFLGNLYRAFFTRISRHVHCDSPQVWQTRLESAGFQLEDWWHYFSPRALHALEWGHYFGLPSLIIHAVTRRWNIAPFRWNFALVDKLIRRYTDASRNPDGAYTFFVARKV
ncbi:MAG: methyltransferase domain-containing protein [Anaerolineae bacterium]|nr:methyltransferase domain-containing protein [Anaerolineae bacterium]